MTTPRSVVFWSSPDMTRANRSAIRSIDLVYVSTYHQLFAL